MHPVLDVIIPCYNEGESLAALISSCEKISNEHPIKFIFVNNGSTDTSSNILHQLVLDKTSIVECLENQGYGGGILAGIAKSTSPYCGWMHGDLQVNTSEIIKFLSLLETEGALYKGVRQGRKASEKFITFGMSTLESIIFRTRLWDINGQPTIFSSDFKKYLTDAPKDFSLDLFTYVKAKSLSMKIIRVEVNFGPRLHGQSSWNTSISSRFRLIRRTLNYSWKLRQNI